MNQEVPPGDMLFGTAVLAVFLVFVFILGKLIYTFKAGRFTRAWAPLVPILQGTVTNDGGGAATSWLTGTYHGKKVQASMVPNRNRYSGESEPRYNHFDVAVLDVPGRQDWEIEHHTAILGFGETGWRIRTDDELLKARLQASGIIETMTRFGCPTVTYRRQARKLEYSEDVTPQWIPTPERFQEELELLLLLEKVNQEVNSG